MTWTQAALVATDFELQRADGRRPRFTGYAGLFDSPSQGLPYTEMVAPGAFKRTLGSGRHFSFVLDHNDALQIATTRAGNLHLSEDSRGLLTEAELPNTTVANDLIGYYEAGMVRGMSFTFKPDRTEKGPNGEVRRAQLQLGHVTAAISLDPVYPDTAQTMQMRALADELQAATDDLESLLDGIREGRALSDDEVALLGRVAAHYTPTQQEPESDEVRASDEEFLASFKAVLEERAATTAQK